MISMAQLASHRADTAKPLQDFDIGHFADVHIKRTSCKPSLYARENVDCGQAATHNATMSTESIGERLKRLQTRSGRSYEEIAKAAGLAGRSSVQRYFSADFDGPLSPAVAKNLAQGLEGTGIDTSEIWAMADIPMPNAYPALSANLQTDGRDIPVYGTALGAPLNLGDIAVEQTELNTYDVIDHFRRPAALRGRKDIYGVYIQGGSMSPRFQEGEIALVDPKRPPQVGDDVLVFTCEPEGEGERISACLIKRLVRRTSDYIELEQFNPAHIFRLERASIKKVHRVIPWTELLA